MTSRRKSTKVPKRNVVMTEVRQQLSMPGGMNGNDDDDESESQSVSRSIASTRSRGQQSIADSTKSSGGKWKRGATMKQYADSGASVSSRSAWSTNSKSKKNDQLVADFFDVKSLASENNNNGNRRKSVSRLSRYSIRHDVDSKSVSSKKSVGGTFMAYFFRVRRINDELEDELDDLSQFYGSEMYSCVDDEELTLGSGLHSETGESMYQEEADDSSVVVKETIRRIMKSAPPKEERKPSLLARMLQRRKENKEKKKAVKGPVARHNVTSGSSVSPYDSRPTYNDEDDARSLPAKRRLTKARSGLQRISSAASIGSNRNSSRKLTEHKIKGSTPTTWDTLSSNDVETHQNRANMLNKTPSCRWSGDSSVEISSSAPKPPIRRRDSTNHGGDTEESTALPQGGQQTVKLLTGRSLQPTASDIPKPPRRQESNQLDDISVDLIDRKDSEGLETVRRESVRREVALRKEKNSPERTDNENYQDESDESVLSLLSGLLATWSAERDGIKGGNPDEDNTDTYPGMNPKRSILKSPSCMEDKPRHTVVFDSIAIREYERTVGDNPSCSRGPPISIGWSYVLAHEYPIDDYELLIKAPKRSKKEFHLSADIRTHLLMEEWDCSEEEIRKARREVTYIQYCRAKSSFSGVRSAAKEAQFLKKQAEGAFAAGANGGSGAQQRSNSGRPRSSKDAPTTRMPRRNVSNDLRAHPSAVVQRQTQQAVPSN